MSSKVVLILGAGANIGKSLVSKFSSQGYKVAIASRTLHPELVKSAHTSVKADFTDPSSIKSIFDKVKSDIGIPDVVIFNGMLLPPQTTEQLFIGE
jgi:NAD(P)-dependent dehydrogenase (short-subunit alcohol dehydrogenase family)